jgi:hypothetical protein
MAILDSLNPLNYADKLNVLENLIADICVEVNQRQSLLNKEFLNLKEVVDTLGEEPPSLERFKGPNGTPELSDLRLNLIRQCKAEFLGLKEERKNETITIISKCKQNIIDLVLDEEGLDSMRQYESLYKKISRFLKNSEFTFGLQKGDINNLIAFSKRLVKEKDDRRAELTKTGDDIAHLWNLLRFTSAEREQFTASFEMNLSLKTLSRGREELRRLKEVRTQSLGKIVNRIREDISSLWEEMGVKSYEEQRLAFPDFFENLKDNLNESVVRFNFNFFYSVQELITNYFGVTFKLFIKL